jgi:hypothetical protein
MKNMKKLSVVCLAILFFYANVQAMLSRDNIGTSTAQFLKLGIGAESAGMGNAVTGVANGTDSIYWNPANLNYLKKIEFSFSHTMWFENVNYEWFAVAIPTEKLGTFGLGLQYVSYGRLDRVDRTGTLDGSFSPLDMAGYLSYANMYKKLKFGFNLKYIYSKIENSASAFAVDMGTTYDLGNNKTAISAAISNLGQDMKFNYKSESLPLLFKVGVSHFLLDQLLVALDLNFPKDNEAYVNAGTEYRLVVANNTAFAFRAGYEGRNKDIPGFNWINLGFGLKYLDYSFNYAFVPYGDIGMTHRFSLSVKLGKDIERK